NDRQARVVSLNELKDKLEAMEGVQCDWPNRPKQKVCYETGKAAQTEYVIPGKPYVGLELPNKKRQTVYLREVLDNDKFRDN
ncbi:hypothetical protein Q6284_33525, partial [Klebsiella pneumoniae]|uniref:hypothetical protein n=1 Tax=Klebsiella pneumoniae TaxID=573 RepID=UPI002730469E